MNGSYLVNFSTVFISMILEGIPFIMIGALVSALIQLFVSEETISKFIPKNKLLGIIIASFLGLFFPVCECAIVPITRRLMKKGVPAGVATTFMLSVPIMNPVVLASTYYAFLGKPSMVLMRAVLGMLCAIVIGYVMTVLYEKNPLRDEYEHEMGHSHNHEHAHDHCCHEHCCGHNHSHGSNVKEAMLEIISHAGSELYDIGKFFMLGAILSSTMQTFLPKKQLLMVGQGNVTSIVAMMILAFVLSICSETDAFIARTFVGQFTSGSILAFLIFGPMLDLKNAIMLYGCFKWGYVTKLILTIIAVTFIAACASTMIPIL